MASMETEFMVSISYIESGRKTESKVEQGRGTARSEEEALGLMMRELKRWHGDDLAITGYKVDPTADVPLIGGAN